MRQGLIQQAQVQQEPVGREQTQAVTVSTTCCCGQLILSMQEDVKEPMAAEIKVQNKIQGLDHAERFPDAAR